jgi:hypothetical protein
MVKVFDGETITDIPRSALALNPGDISGDLVSGGTINNFASTGIKDKATKQTLVVEDDKITVKNIKVSNVDGSFTVRGDVKIYGVLDAGFVRTTELITNQRYEKQYLEFAEGDKETTIGTGLLWRSSPYNKQFVLLANPDRFFSTEHIEVTGGRNFMINGQWVINEDSLGDGIMFSNLRKVGRLMDLSVSGALNLDDEVFYDPISKRFGIGTEFGSARFTVQDEVNDIEMIIDGEGSGVGKFGVRNTKSLGLVTDDQIRILVDEKGDITFGHEMKDSTITRAYGKFSVGIKNPREQFEVAGNMRLGGRLHGKGDEPPVEGTHVVGDIIWNTKPRPGGFVGWICIQNGNPGLWKPWGPING